MRLMKQMMVHKILQPTLAHHDTNSFQPTFNTAKLTSCTRFEIIHVPNYGTKRRESSKQKSAELMGSKTKLVAVTCVPRPVTYESPESVNVKSEDTSLAGRTASHPSVAGNPSVLQPGLYPSAMSLMPPRPSPYSRGLSQPSASLPFRIW